MIELRNGDCLELMKNIPDKSVDLILCDLPYGTTSCDFDNVIPLNKLWAEYNRIIKDNHIIALFCAQPFTTELISSNILNFKYTWVWVKNRGVGFQYAKSQPMRQTEDIAIFNKTLNDTAANHPLFNDLKKYFLEEKEKCGLTNKQFKELLGNNMASHYFTNGIQWCLPNEKAYKKLQKTGFFKKDYAELKLLYDSLLAQIETSKVVYYPQMIKLDKPVKYSYSGKTQHAKTMNKNGTYYVTEKYPTNVLNYSNVNNSVHPTQKPVALLEYLIKTYSNEGETILDNCMGSGSTGVASINTNRNFIGIELDEKYFKIAEQRINAAIAEKE